MQDPIIHRQVEVDKHRWTWWKSGPAELAMQANYLVIQDHEKRYDWLYSQASLELVSMYAIP